MLPASALPNTHACSLKGDDTTTPQPCTTTVYVSAAGPTRLTSSADVPLPLEPTNAFALLNTHMSMSEPGLTSASNSENRAYVVPAGTTTGIRTALGDVNEHVLLVGSSSTVPAVMAAGIRPRAVAVKAP